MSYEAFVERKLATVPPTGLGRIPALSDSLFPFQQELVAWALRRGRAALFADTGLGKTRMQLEWARHVPGRRVLILAPLAVAAQTAAEGAKLGLAVRVCREASDVDVGINITNYDRLHKFNPSDFDAVVLDESSCIKHHDTKTLKVLLDAFRDTAFKLCATATPSPNDYTELGTHAEFLGICTRTEMLAEYFCHDGGETQVWRLKGHARSAFWRWVSSWGALVRSPADLGHDASAYELPGLHTYETTIPADSDSIAKSGLLFAAEAQTLSERRDARRASLNARVSRCAELVNDSKEPWIVWCDLNAESESLNEAIPDAVEVRGSDSLEDKEARLSAFSRGEIRVLISKPSICGWGLNWQHCAHMAFVGVTDSYEAYYQAIRRIWRFGQKRECHVHVFASELEGAVLKNLKRKEAAAASMADELSKETWEALRSEIRGQGRSVNPYTQSQLTLPMWIYSNPEVAP